MRLYGQHSHEVAERIIDAFKHPEQLPKALAPIFIRRKDDVPCRRWSWHNQLIVALCGTMDARGIRQWRDVGRHIKKGSKALWILAPCMRTVTQEDEYGREAKRQIVHGFRSVPVFRLEDTEGDLLPGAEDKYNEWVRRLPLVEVAEAWDINVGTYSHTGDGPHGYYRYGAGGQAIMLAVENSSTWAHELVHAADHRVTGLKGEKWHKEVVAGLGSATLLRCLELEEASDLGGAFAYIAHYAERAQMPAVRVCIAVLDRVCESVKLILDTAEQLQEVTAPAQPA